LPPTFDVVGLGSATVDILSLVDHFPDREEVQQAQAIVLDGGGPVATAMVTLARLGAKVAMIDAVGDDWQGRFIRESLQREGVSTNYLRVIASSSSSASTIMVRQGDGARSIVFAPGRGADLTVDDLPRDLLASAAFLHINGRHWELCLQTCRYAREHGVQVSFDGGAQRYRPAMRELVPLTDICIVARDFAESYTQTTEIWQAGQVLLSEGPRLVGITDGARGSWIFSQGDSAFHQPAYLLPRVVDTTGCGDSYHGAFLFGLRRRLDLRQTAALASAVAALNTQQLGGRAGLPTYEQVTAFLAEVDD
jgi:sulfofructose kinase